MIRDLSLAKGMFSTKISLAKGIWSKTGAAHPRQFFFRVPPPLPGLNIIKWPMPLGARTWSIKDVNKIL